MADRIKGITIEIGGDTTGLNKALSGVNKEIRNTQSQLKDVERLLKLDPSNTELLSQKQKLLTQAVKETKDKLDTLKNAEQQVQQQFAEGKISQEQYDALKREVIETEEKLKSLEGQAERSNVAMQKIGMAGDKFQETGKKIEGVGEALTPITAAVTGIGAAAVKTTADFDSAMSKVAAISGASGEDFDRLREKAREMGAKTKFSATEAAEAFKYMAMAGWDTAQMLDGIEGIMNLSAADGLALATTSDIVTDALTAFGLQAADAGHFADVLAKASSSANTNVSMLGESFKYVAPIAGTLGFSAEDTAVALGLMANAGIKGSQAGTALKTAFANLASPTSNMARVMTEFNIDLVNTDGTMKSLSQLMDELRSNMKVTTDAEREQNYTMQEQQLVAEGYAKELSGLTEEEKKLYLEYTKGQDIVAAMSEKQLKEAADTRLQIKLTKDRKLTSEEYYKLCQKEGQDALDGITQAEQAAAASTLFGKEAMAGMLNIINASEQDYRRLSDAIGEADGTANTMAETMQDNLPGQITILKSQIQELAISIGDLLMPTIRGIVSSVQGWVSKFNNLNDATKKMIVVIGLILAAIGPVLIMIGKMAAGFGAVLKVFSGIGKLTSLLSGIGKLTSIFTALTGPIGIAIAAVAALTAGFVYLWNNSEAFREFWINLWENVKSITRQVVDSLVNFFAVTIPEGWNKLVELLRGIPDWWESLWSSVKDKFVEIWDQILQNPIVQIIVQSITDRWNNLVSTMHGIWENIKTMAAAAWELIKNVVLGPVLLLTDLVTGDFTKLKEDAQNIWTNIKNALVTIWNAFKDTIVNIITGLLKDAEIKFKALKDMIVLIVTNIKNKAVESFKNLVDGIKEKLIALPSIVKAGFQEAIDFITSLPEKAWEWGADFVDGLVKGITSKIDAIKEAASNIGEKIREFLHFSRPDVGPLRDYETWMPDMIKGMTQGIKDNIWRVTEQMSALSGAMKGTLIVQGSGVGQKDSGMLEQMMALLDGYLPIIAQQKYVMMDSKTLVGTTANQMDMKLGQTQALKERIG